MKTYTVSWTENYKVFGVEAENEEAAEEIAMSNMGEFENRCDFENVLAVEADDKTCDGCQLDYQECPGHPCPDDIKPNCRIVAVGLDREESMAERHPDDVFFSLCRQDIINTAENMEDGIELTEDEISEIERRFNKCGCDWSEVMDIIIREVVDKRT